MQPQPHTIVDKIKDQEKQAENARKNVRSPLATNNYFSQFDKIVEHKLSKGDVYNDISMIQESVANKGKFFVPLNPLAEFIKGGGLKYPNSSMSSTTKPYSRKKMVLNRDKKKNNTRDAGSAFSIYNA